MTPGVDRQTAPTGTRLLRGLGGKPTSPGLADHLDRWGALPHHRPAVLMDELEASGLVGHGGAWFPVASKWRYIRVCSMS